MNLNFNVVLDFLLTVELIAYIYAGFNLRKSIRNLSCLIFLLSIYANSLTLR